MGFGNLGRPGRFAQLGLTISLLLIAGSCASTEIENTVATGGELPPVNEFLNAAEADALKREELRLVSAELDGLPLGSGAFSNYSSSASTPRRSEELIYGDQTFVADVESGEEATAQPAPHPGGESFVFRNAPIDAVVNEVLGQTFGLSYSIAPDVRGTITVRLDGISTPEQAVANLDAALGLQGLDIVNTGASYVVGRQGSGLSPTASQPVFVGVGDELPTGTSMAVLQIRFAQLADVTELAKVMLPDGIIRYTDEDRGFVVLEGEPDAVSSGVQLLKSLDVNWLSSVSTALIPIENANPVEVAADLEPILSKLGGVSVVPLERLQTLMVVSRRRDSLDQVRTWIARLDKDARPKLSSDTLVYEARYVGADHLAEIVSGTFAGRASGASFAQVQPELSLGVRDYQSQQGVTQPPGGRVAGASDPGLYGELAITIDRSRNAVIARGPIADLESLSSLFEVIDQPQRQVLIEATIVEVSLTENNQFGVQWDVIANQLRATFSDASNGAVSSLFPGASVSFVNSDISAVLNVLALTSDVEIVSSPRILVLNNETANLQIGDEVPIITQSAVSVIDPGAPIVNSTTYRDTGVILTVTPSIRAGGMVEIEISQEVSGVSETTTSNIDSPTISQRSIESRLAVPDGSTAVLGGLMSSTRAFNETGVPVLKDVPALGAAFRSQGISERRTELVVLVEPTVVLSAEPSVDIPIVLREALISAQLGAS